jgi:hypothetical protein
MTDTFVQELEGRISTGGTAAAAAARGVAPVAQKTAPAAAAPVAAAPGGGGGGGGNTAETMPFETSSPAAQELLRLIGQRRRMVEMRTQTGPHQVLIC